jgi:hypothetical protein
MLRTPILLTFLVSCSSPAIAQIRQDIVNHDNYLIQKDHTLKLLEEATDLMAARNWKAACKKYNEVAIYKQKNKLDLFHAIPKNATSLEANSIHESNIIIGESNKIMNDSAKLICRKAGIKPVLTTAEMDYEGVYIRKR